MKKASVKKQYPSVRKNATFVSLWDYYRRVQKDYLAAVKRVTETEETWKQLKDSRAASTLLKAWKAELKRAKNCKQLQGSLVKHARKHVHRWLDAYEAKQDCEDGRSKLKKATKKKKTAAKKKSASKSSKKAASTKKTKKVAAPNKKTKKVSGG